MSIDGRIMNVFGLGGDLEAIDRELGFVDKRDRLNVIALLFDMGRITAPGLARLLGEWWSDAECPSVLGPDRLVRLFRAAGFVTDAEGVAPPQCPLTVYRGVSRGGRGSWCGPSWTRDEAMAIWFARRWHAMGRAGTV